MNAYIDVDFTGENEELNTFSGLSRIEIDYEIAKYMVAGDKILHPKTGDEIEVKYRFWDLTSEGGDLILDCGSV